MKKTMKKTKAPASRLYTLTNSGKEFSGKGTHAVAALKALKKAGWEGHR